MPQLSQSGVDGLEDSRLVCDVQSMWEEKRESEVSRGNKSMRNRPIEQDAKAGKMPPPSEPPTGRCHWPLWGRVFPLACFTLCLLAICRSHQADSQAKSSHILHHAHILFVLCMLYYIHRQVTYDVCLWGLPVLPV